ncbi:hypothetical protein RHSIM_Rhsim09G0164600 [Rhododendron simsii]|uniref:CCHC-type domain-containing protein n=1 Tax=Rhododendron simsii TaxID=118357 RepID=A0A834LGP4_RHOSS|nr:hypothetical protein RHSIM_Rhsim09G0164600 [Rhododendron simsii]
MSLDRRSPSRAKRYRSSERASFRDAPYQRDRRMYRQDYLCNNCKRPGHFGRDCPNVTVCNNCGLPGLLQGSPGAHYQENCFISMEVEEDQIYMAGLQHRKSKICHVASECTSTTTCWNCKEPGHLANECNNDPVCHMCGNMGHLARDCSNSSLPSHDVRLCNNCYKAGHLATDCTNDKACNNCRKTGHLARDCPNDPVCNVCNISGHMARQCPKSHLPPMEMVGGPFRDMICRNCGLPGHISRDCVSIVICNNCGGRGHQGYQCPSVPMLHRGLRRF